MWKIVENIRNYSPPPPPLPYRNYNRALVYGSRVFTVNLYARNSLFTIRTFDNLRSNINYRLINESLNYLIIISDRYYRRDNLRVLTFDTTLKFASFISSISPSYSFSSSLPFNLFIFCSRATVLYAHITPSVLYLRTCDWACRPRRSTVITFEQKHADKSAVDL